MTYCSVTSTVGPTLQSLPVQTTGVDGGASFRFNAPQGLYQLSVIIDAARFDWERLYFPLHLYGNTGQRTGPWDFDLRHENKPLVPSYRVSIDGRYVGIWFFQRVSLEDLAARRFRGHMACWLQTGGEHQVSLVPFQPMEIDWLHARLEPDPEDELRPPPPEIKQAEHNTPVAKWSQEDFWERQRLRLQSSHAMFQRPLRKAFDGAMAAEQPDVTLLPLLVAAHWLDHRDGALRRALDIIDHTVALRAWGNPNPDSYGHNGDMNAAYALQYMAWSLHMISPNVMGEPRRRRLLDKLAMQGDVFVDLALLNRDYWGGSLLQDHGRKSFNAFTIAALNLYGMIPQAERWLHYALPRMRRGLDAAPRDGVIPASSYFAPRLYLDDTTWLRDTLLTLSGEDLFDTHPELCRVVDYVYNVLNERDGEMLLPSNLRDRVPLDAGGTFFARMATKFHDSRAQWLVLRTLEGPVHPQEQSQSAIRSNALWSFLAYEPGELAPAPPPDNRRQLLHFQDSGLVHYRDDAAGITLSLQCGPWLGYHAYHAAKGPMDRMASAPGEGHFLLAIDGVPLLMTPENGYRLRSFLRTCLLIDDQGQNGDVGYPMSIPSMTYRGQEIQHFNWNPNDGTGLVRLNLKPAYPDYLDVIHYTRDLIFSPGRQIFCRDDVLLGRPRRLSWLFQSQRDQGMELESPLRCRIGAKPRLWIEPTEGSPRLHADICPTDVVWSYSGHNGYKPFSHVRYDSIDSITAACATFRITWPETGQTAGQDG
ncbi:MAG: hypothetical protein IT446_10050 [Phycisphaerales bacterium]|nr:hypothetical protein [Phycisphaerales bacterium]